MTGKLEGKVVILAGAGGIGDGLAERYAEDGANLIIGDINGDHGAALAERLDPSGKQVIGLHLDGADETSIESAVKLAVSEFGKLTGFHANFACGADSVHPEGLQIPMELFDEVMRVNVRGFMLCSRLAVPAMIDAGGGALVYTSSTAATTGSAVRFGYGMAKAAIQALARHVAFAHGKDGIRANAIAPGFISHPKIVAKLPGVAEQAMSRAAIRTRVGQPSDVAAVGSLLLSDDGSYITGQVITVDAGITMRP